MPKIPGQLSDVTIICLTFGRPHFVFRQIAYFADTEAHLVIADGSIKPMNENHLKNLRDLRCRITYLHVAGADTQQTRIQLASRTVDTEYVLLIDDADHFFITGIEKAADELRRDQERLVAAGRVGSFDILPRLEFRDWGRWSNALNLCSSSRERVLELVMSGRTANAFYVVMRSVTLLEMCRESLIFRFSNGNINELFVSSFLVSRSAFRLSNFPFWMRGSNPSIATNLYDRQTQSEWFESAKSEQTFFTETIARELSHSSSIDIELARETAHELLAIVFRQSLPRLGDTVSHILKRLLPFLPLTLQDFVKKTYRALVRVRFPNLNVDSRLLAYWGRTGTNLSQDQLSDLRSSEKLLNEFPQGIPSLKILQEAISPKPEAG